MGSGAAGCGHLPVTEEKQTGLNPVGPAILKCPISTNIMHFFGLKDTMSVKMSDKYQYNALLVTIL